MKGVIEIDRIVYEEVEKEHWWETQEYVECKIKISIVKSKIKGWVDGRVYMDDGSSFGCENSYEELTQKYNEA